jgi:hypothetical protein
MALVEEKIQLAAAVAEGIASLLVIASFIGAFVSWLRKEKKPFPIGPILVSTRPLLGVKLCTP